MHDALTFVAAAAAGEAGGGGGASAVLPSLTEIWPTLVAFVILFIVLSRFAFPPIMKMMEKRADTIRDSLERAEETKVEAERLLEEYKQQMAEARAEAGKVIDQGRKVAESMRAEIVAKANEDAASIVAKAKERIEAERKAALADLQSQIAELAVAVAGKIIGERLTVADHEKLIDRYLAEAGGLDE
ncbi:MAG: F0F1 ATP synthase subunit B [Coriobacteriia bacterium]|nr:F0F1 ATP synthase subunit B [Coriobacteriia bacterium]